MNVVRAVQNESSLPHPLETAGPDHIGQTTLHRLRRRIKATGTDQREGKGGILSLVRSGKPQLKVRGNGLCDPFDRCIHLQGHRGKGFGRFPLLWRDHHRDPRTEDPGLLSCDLAEGLAEPFRMIKSDRGDCAGNLRGEIRCIQASTKTGLKDHHVATSPGKKIQSQCGRQFEEGGLVSIGFREK